MEQEKKEVKNNKKQKIIWIVVSILLLLVIGTTIFIINQNNKSYEIETITQFSYFKLYENEKYGVIDANGNVIVEPKYDMLAIPNPSKAVFIGYFDYNSQKGEYETEVLNEKNEKILTQYEQVLPFMFKDTSTDVPYEKSILMYKENNKYGIIDFQGKKITKPIYDEIESILYKEGCLLVKQEDRYGIITMKGKQLIETKYNSISADGYYDEETKYQKAGFVIGLKKEQGYRYGYINANGDKILEVEYNEIDRITEITDTKDVYLLAFKNGQAGIYQDKKQIIKHAYEEIEYNKQNKLFIVQKNGKQGVVNIEGQQILNVEYDYIMISNQNIDAEKEGTTYYFDINGKQKENIEDVEGIDIENSYVEHAYDDYFIVTKEDKVGVVDANKNIKIEFLYDVIQKVKDANVLQAIIAGPNTVIELYNEKMEKVISMKDANLSLEKDYIKLYSNTERKYFDKNGKELEVKEIFLNLPLYAFYENEKWGFKDSEGNIKVDANYDMVTELNTYGFAGIKKEGKWGVINSNGEIIVEPSYTIEFDEPEFIGPYCKLNFGYGIVYYTKELTK